MLDHGVRASDGDSEPVHGGRGHVVEGAGRSIGGAFLDTDLDDDYP